MPDFLLHLIGGAGGSVIILSLAIIVGTFILEDTTTVIVGLLVADGAIGLPIALSSLYIGIILGDIGLYCLGRLARTHPRLALYVDHEFVAPVRTWLDRRYVLTIFSARFVPGLRIPTFIASGFFRSPFSTFMLTIVIAATMGTTILFSASYWFGNFTAGWLGPVRWGIALLFVLIIFCIGKHNLHVYRTKKDGTNPPLPE